MEDAMKTIGVYGLTRISISVFLCGAIVFWGASVFGQEWAAEQKEVWDVVVADYELFKQGDVEGILASRDDDVAIWYGNNKVPLNKELLKLNYKGWFDYDKLVSLKLEPVEIKIIGNVASVFYTYKLSGNIMSFSGRAMKTWIKQNNGWILINSHSSSCDKLPPCD